MVIVGDGVGAGVMVGSGVWDGVGVRVAGMVMVIGGDGVQERTAAMIARARIRRARRIVMVRFIRVISPLPPSLAARSKKSLPS